MSEITLEMLRAKGACEDALAEFQRRFGARVTVTEDIAASVAEAFSWCWAARELLSPAGLNEYKRARDHAWAEYKRMRDPARAESSRDPAWAEYNRACARAFARLMCAEGRAMSESKHTQGPWTVKSGNCGSMLGIISPTRPVAMLGLASAINPADATLIAAAPDLLALAKRMLAAWEGSGPGIVLDDIRALIAKAEGRSYGACDPADSDDDDGPCPDRRCTGF